MATISASTEEYYDYVCTQLQDETEYVLKGPGNSGKRLYNWPWVMHLHVVTSALDITFSGSVAYLNRWSGSCRLLTISMQKVEQSCMPSGCPSTKVFGRSMPRATRASTHMNVEYLCSNSMDSSLWTERLDDPVFEVNFEQLIVAPATIMLLEPYRWTGDKKSLTATELQLETLLRFSVRQQGYRLHDIAIKYCNGYWDGKDHMWGDVFPHRSSTLNAFALHHCE